MIIAVPFDLRREPRETIDDRITAFARTAARTEPDAEYISVRELARRLGLTAKTIYNRISNGTLGRDAGYRKLGRRVLFNWQLVQAALARGRRLHPIAKPQNERTRQPGPIQLELPLYPRLLRAQAGITGTVKTSPSSFGRDNGIAKIRSLGRRA
jgi:excisionase family DNA binding protein